VGPGQTLTLQVSGNGGVPLTTASDPPTSVVLNVTATNETAQSFVTVYPTGEPLPVVSNLNTVAATTIPNLVTVELGTNGQVNLYNFSGSTDLVADVFGYFDSQGTTGSDYHAAPSPNRILDTRSGQGAPQAPLGPGQTLPLQVSGTADVPAGATAVVLNMTATNTTATSFLTVWPAGLSQPTASNLNWSAGVSIPNLVVVPLSGSGQVSIFNNSGSTDVVADVEGFYGPTGATSSYTAVSPTRILDTRSGLGDSGPVGPGGSINLTVQGNGGVPSSGAAAVVMNTTVTDTTSPSFLTLYPEGTAQPTASNLNWVAGQTIPNLVNVGLGPTNGAVTIFNNAGDVDVVGDVAGYYTG